MKLEDTLEQKPKRLGRQTPEGPGHRLLSSCGSKGLQRMCLGGAARRPVRPEGGCGPQRSRAECSDLARAEGGGESLRESRLGREEDEANWSILGPRDL